jgi:hypothetical protein
MVYGAGSGAGAAWLLRSTDPKTILLMKSFFHSSRKQSSHVCSCKCAYAGRSAHLNLLNDSKQCRYYRPDGQICIKVDLFMALSNNALMVPA